MKKIFQIKAELLYNKRVKENYFHCALKAPEIARLALPGQFISARLDSGFKPFLRRPFSVHRVKAGNIELLYEVLGIGTEVLAKKKPGEYLDVMGPRGNGFNYKSQSHKVTKSQVLVAGGMGVAPLIFLAEKIKEHGLLVLIGARTKKQILCEKEFKDLGCEVRIATDDGSGGFKGRVTDLLKNLLRVASCELRVTIFACGPKPMLKEIASISKRCHVPAQISLEEHMACGFGACLGCAVKTRDGYKRACKEGPVFNAHEITWKQKGGE
jgi:dihydroorotate dehydrogenase electron transfer subunit